MRYFTSDWHLGHANILRYAHRPFATPEAMADHLIGRFNATITDDDEVWLLGDLVMGQMVESLPLVSRLRGRIILVPGNHDRCWAGFEHRRDPEAKRVEWRQKYLDAGIAEIVDDPAPLVIGGETVELSHFPYRGGGDHTGEERFPEWRREDHGRWLLCGHVHDLFRQQGRQINVGLDAWAGEMVPEPEIEALIATGPADRPSLPWPSRPGWPTPAG
ncbi:MAG: metallophosphoesterase [Acidimicrobiales bacterium]